MSNLSWISSQMTMGMTIDDIAHENVSKICTELHLGIANNITKGSFQLLLHQGDFPFFFLPTMDSNDFCEVAAK
jgi:hypothetical protein